MREEEIKLVDHGGGAAAVFVEDGGGVKMVVEETFQFAAGIGRGGGECHEATGIFPDFIGRAAARRAAGSTVPSMRPETSASINCRSAS